MHKYVHVALQSVSGVFILLGMVYVGKFKKASKEVFFYSLHSWTGIIAIVLYFVQYVAGTYLASHLLHTLQIDSQARFMVRIRIQRAL